MSEIRVNGYSPDYAMRRRMQDCGCRSNRIPKQAMSCRLEDSPMACYKEEKRKKDLQLGFAYVPMQEWRELYDISEGFCKGTIFKELDYPWGVGRCVCR